jgi:hypothetical protein
MPDATRSQPPKLLGEVRTVLYLHHYSSHTERSSRSASPGPARSARPPRPAQAASLFPHGFGPFVVAVGVGFVRHK